MRAAPLRLLLAAVAVLTVLPATATSSAAQARTVRVDVSTRPARPVGGDDVTVRIRIRGCEPGPVQAEVYLLSDDGLSQNPVRMADAAAVTSLWFRSNARIQLPAAADGWYGVRVICGNFRPPRGPLPNTTFAVGADAQRTWRLSAAAVPQGGSLRVEGTSCRGPRAELQIREPGLVEAGFQSSAQYVPDAAGNWSGDVTFPAALPLGPIEVRARCVVTNGEGDEGYVPYLGLTTVTVLRAETTTGG